MSVRTFIKELSGNEAYADKLQLYVEKQLSDKGLNGWNLTVNEEDGRFSFSKDGVDLIIFATPMLNGVATIPFTTERKSDGRTIKNINRMLGTIVLIPSYDVAKDYKRYVQLLYSGLNRAEKALNAIR